nr:type I pantothenate kinase [Hyphomonas sp. Mor2]
MATPDYPMTVGIDAVADRIREIKSGRPDMVIALTGSVASGKSTLARHLEQSLEPALAVDTVSTDGFLFPTDYLREQGLFQRKGFPETYDRTAMRAAIESVRRGPTDFPGYSHITFDPDPALTRTIEDPDILILEGLGFEPRSGPSAAPHEPDLLIYLDAELAHIEAWFLERFLRFWHAAEHDPTSFYAQFRHMSEDELIAFAKTVWAGINLPNLENHILPLRAQADLVVRKDEAHAVKIAADRWGGA